MRRAYLTIRSAVPYRPGQLPAWMARPINCRHAPDGQRRIAGTVLPNPPSGARSGLDEPLHEL